MNQITTSLTGILIKPESAFRRLLLRQPIGLALISLVLTLVSGFASQWASQAGIFSANPGAFFGSLPLKLIIFFCLLFLLSALWHMTADILGGAGRGFTLLLLVVVAMVPFWLIGISAFIFLVAMSLPIVHTVVSWVLVTWSFILVTTAVKSLYRFSWIRSLLTLILPVILFGLAWMLLMILIPGLDLPPENLPDCLVRIFEVLNS